jgi:hypothetical protein
VRGCVGAEWVSLATADTARTSVSAINRYDEVTRDMNPADLVRRIILSQRRLLEFAAFVNHLVMALFV